MKTLALVLLILLLGAVPSQADWQRDNIAGTGTDLTGTTHSNNSLIVSKQYPTAYYYWATGGTPDSGWLQIAKGCTVKIYLNTHTTGTTANGTTAIIRVLSHNTDTTPILNDAHALLNLTMSFTEDQIYDLDGPVKILVDPVVQPAAAGAYVSVIVQSPKR